MEILDTSLHEVRLFEPEPFHDDRGFFVRTLSAAVLEKAGIDHSRFVEESQSRSRHGVLRGLHGRTALSEAKLFRCARGAVAEVVVDLRPWSPSFLRWEQFIIDDRQHRHLYVPPGCVHGFQVVSEHADVCYQMDAIHEPTLDLSVAWDDPDLAIRWPIPKPILSERDRSAPSLASVKPRLADWFGAEPDDD
jgi:dTDP-4-dehydrorhamnose 3,5-epimerase